MSRYRLGIKAVQYNDVVACADGVNEVSAVFHIHTHPRVLHKPTIRFGHIDDILIEFDDINRGLREMAVKESGKRPSTQANDQNAQRVLNKSESRWQNPGVSQLEMSRICRLYHALGNSTCAKAKSA
ncbi:hypothetical protein CfE428DRAFT_3005 [Chthoniobacter flavus Ellin428]|uniref:Uncharacterized protein n=1 Tax=Chthoniobacter flavus Ellin428 TaxID=497964 RepID=B4D280_9BACT|nr:hypothetical protein CfE428DRAFT_3005 [Chthoniobacter flavus Ellin428]TCO90549.1 hypothetical protein EV701_110173 [Chthoniobacter flavus]